MVIQNLPYEVEQILSKYNAPPRLKAHLILVHDTALMLIKKLSAYWPLLAYDKDAVLLGAATHDIGKIIYTNELSSSGNEHEEIGPRILQEHGFPEKYTRFARTHARWYMETPPTLEDLLVALADTIWKGGRDEKLEQEIVRQISTRCQEEAWSVYMKLDDITCDIAINAHERIIWQGRYPV